MRRTAGKAAGNAGGENDHSMKNSAKERCFLESLREWVSADSLSLGIPGLVGHVDEPTAGLVVDPYSSPHKAAVMITMYASRPPLRIISLPPSVSCFSTISHTGVNTIPVLFLMIVQKIKNSDGLVLIL